MTRVEQALAEIARRRALALAATPSPWTHGDASQFSGPSVYAHDKIAWVAECKARGTEDAEYIAANDPAHVLAVLDAAEATLNLHAPAPWWDPEFSDDDDGIPCAWCTYDDRHVLWPCQDALAVVDIYVPEGTR